MTALSPPGARGAWPPPPHDPRERVRLVTLDGWEVRGFARTNPKYVYFAPRGLTHLQLWEPRAGVSVLTPSRLTRWRFEAFPIEGWKRTTPDYAELAAILRRGWGLSPPDARAILGLVQWYARPEEPGVDESTAALGFP